MTQLEARGPPRSVRHRKGRVFLALASCVIVISFLRALLFPPTKALFAISLEPLPVFHDEKVLHFHNHPVSKHRPRNQFVSVRSSRHPPPVLTVFTVTQNPAPATILETYESLHQQSLQAFRWLIINDHTTEPASIAILNELVQRDSRIVVVDNDGAKGVCNARNKAIEVALAFGDTKYISALDDDDILELTTLEKAVWMLESNPEWDLASFYWVKFGAQNVTEVNGVHLGLANYYSENYVANAAIFRATAIGSCRYDDEFSKGGEDWDFWLCMAEAGHWGGTLPEFAYWYRVNPKIFRAARWGDSFNTGLSSLKQRIQFKHRNLDRVGGIPITAPHRSIALEPVSWSPPFPNSITHASKSIMFVLPWLYVGGADIGALHMIQIFAEAGYRVTVVCTLYKNPQGIELRPLVMQWTHDIHILPSFLRANDFPRYIKYLIQSRGIEDVVLSNSQLMYELLPALTEQLPHVKFIDYLHNEAYDGWKSGGYPTYSIISQRYLARTITCSNYLKQWVTSRGHSLDRIGVVKLGIEIADFSPTNASARAIAKRDLLDVSDSTVVITIVARLDPQKRSMMVPLIADHLRNLGAENFVIVMLGDGDSGMELKERIKSLKVGTIVRLLGTVDRPQDFLAATDIFLLPSVSEGISIAVAEAMAMGLPIVTARAGALPEQLGEAIEGPRADTPIAGVLVNHTLDNALDAPMYAAELLALINDVELREGYGRIARRNVENTFDWRSTLRGMFGEIGLAQNSRHLHDDLLPNPAAYFSIEKLLVEAWSETDFAAFQATMKAPQRQGVGRELQDRCGEATQGMSNWIEHVSEPMPCNAKEPINAPGLVLSAKFQCGAWCIFDLSTPLFAGWSYNGKCFSVMDDKSWCKAHWTSRPAIQLSNAPEAAKAAVVVIVAAAI